MSCPTAFRLTQGVYHLFLGVWVGAMAMLGITAAAIFMTIRSFAPTLHKAPYDAAVLQDRASDILGGATVGQTIHGLNILQIVCAAVVLVCVILQCTAFRDRLAKRLLSLGNSLRLLLLAAAGGLLIASLVAIEPPMWHLRDVMFNPANSPAVRAEAETKFQRHHRLSENAAKAELLLLAAAMLVSPFAFGTKETTDCTDDTDEES